MRFVLVCAHTSHAVVVYSIVYVSQVCVVYIHMYVQETYKGQHTNG